MQDLKAYVAELIATFALCFIGAGAIVTNTYTDGAVGLVGIALAHGVVLAIMINATGHISGAHVNPAVTIGFMITKRIKVGKGIGYIISQLAGGVQHRQPVQPVRLHGRLPDQPADRTGPGPHPPFHAEPGKPRYLADCAAVGAVLPERFFDPIVVQTWLIPCPRSRFLPAASPSTSG